RAEILADVGAYTRSLGVLCPSLTAAGLPGAYRIRDYTCRVRAALTCKAPAAAYRGAGQPEAVFAIERALDHLPQTLEIDPGELRRRNFIGRDEFPWEVGTASAQVPVIYDNGDYQAALDTALMLSRYDERRAAQALERAKEARGRLLGIGVAAYVMLTGLGPHAGGRCGAWIRAGACPSPPAPRPRAGARPRYWPRSWPMSSASVRTRSP